MKPLHYKTHTLAKRGLSLLCVLALCLGLLPATALAVDAPNNLYVGNTNFASTIYPGNAAYWTSSDGGTNWTLQQEKPTGDSYIHYDGNGTLTLHNANIQGQDDSSNGYYGYGIYAVGASGSAVSLTIQLEGTNTVSGWSGIFVHAVDGAASLSISGTGSLAAEGTGGGSFSGIVVQGNGGKAELTINNVDVTATNNEAQGIGLQSAGTSPATLAVNGGSLTASGSKGIDYQFGTGTTGSGTPTVTVSNNAIVRANGGISDNSSTDIQIGADSSASNGGIVFDGKNGTVYGDVTLQENLTIGEGESLTIPDGSSLTIPDGKTLTVNGGELTVNGGTLNGTPSGDVTYKVTGVSLNKDSLTLDVGSSETLNAAVAPADATNQAVTWSSDKPEVATVEGGKVTAVSAGTATITVTTEDGQKTATCTVTVTDKTYTISADTTALNFGSAYTGYAQPAAKTVTLTNTGNQQVTVTLPTANDFIITAGTGFTDGSAAIKPGETATFTVQPKAGLSAGTYSDTITVSGSENVIVTIPASFTVKSRPSYNPPTVSEETTDAIADAQPGETVTVDLSSGSTKLDKDVFETLAGKDVTLVVELGDGLSWTVNGSDIPEDADFVDIDMGVTMNSVGIPVNVINTITGEVGTVQITLAHNGEFGFTMTLTAPLGKENAGYWANLYHYKVNGGEADREDPLGDDERAEALNFEAAAKIDETGSVTIPFSHASQYAIVIDTHSHATVDVSDLFIDIARDAWYKDAIQYAYAGGLMTGVSDTEFAPEATTTRAMIVSILARLEGVESAQAAGFADVDDNDWYATAVNWAANVGVVNGYEDNTFRPNTAITREQLAAILMNYAAYKGQDVSARASLDNYTDQPSTWATEAMSWAVAEGLISGVTADTLQPQGAATRAQVAAILQRFLSE